MINWTDPYFFAITHIINALLFLSIGYLVGQKTEKGEVYKYVIGTIVILVWVYHVVISSQNATILVSNWEHIMAGLVVWSLWGSKNGEKNSFIDIVIPKLTGLVNAKTK